MRISDNSRARFFSVVGFVIVLLSRPNFATFAQEASEPADNEPAAATQPQAVLLDGKTPAERAAALVRFVASCKPSAKNEAYPKEAAPAFAARLILNIDTAYALEQLRAAVQARIERGHSHPLDPFDKAALIYTYLLCKEKIPPATAEKIRDYAALYRHKVWKGYGAMNYRLMEDGAGFLAAEQWPGIVDADGLNATQIKAATKGRLLGYFDGICRHDFAEYGSPIYTAVDLSAMRMLAQFAHDPEIQKRASLTLDAMMLDIACTWNHGYNIGSAARAKYWVSTDTSPQEMESTATDGWIWFGGDRPITGAGTGWDAAFWMAAPGSYSVPELITKVAGERAQPSVFRETVSAMASQQVHRITFHSLHFSLASQWDHCSSPTDSLYKESRRNMLKWFTDKPSSTFAVCMENPRRPYALAENVANVIGYGENPYSEYLQNDGTLIGLYWVPEIYPYYKMYVPFTTRGAILKRVERNGWVFCHNGVMLMGFHSMKRCTWSPKPWNGNDMLWCDARVNGWILETAELAAYAGGGVDAELDRFADAVLKNTRESFSETGPSRPGLQYRSLSGHTLYLTWIAHKTPYVDQSKIDGRAVDYASWPRLESPWVSQAIDSPTLQITIGGHRLIDDFSNWSRGQK